ncbi:1,6-anhydro-N-acetylmuramyl-L-alanine amidase AmpD [Marinobacter confluentis]|uniref:1,6-anhydro-N-acetylmuramyl-L-alanine amidase AmpD n=1 Tax=Marinobacter confluentis TaxID=1697557 RepID=A0A4Z1BGG3_9GAMM|nr:1,6-anhydro-N-acetylmuramyl-L-alanine amidase AmpD [Marinobacter confluentis]TGN41934.1 1,6-anhydro-N-acetylmuramyl-L-alanine amidase AmpD [Marinobacter confluentis]
MSQLPIDGKPLSDQNPVPSDQHALHEQAQRLRASGRIEAARWCASPNYNQRPDGQVPSLLVVHNISLPPGQFSGDAIEQFFCNQLDPGAHPYFQTIADLKVSSHLLVRRDGSLLQFVDLRHRAWHAGRSSFQGQTECNDFSIGIELEGTDDTPYTDVQYRQLAQLSVLIMAAWPDITPARITGHSDIAPGRKTDPGQAFDWSHFRVLLAGALGNRGVT